MVKQEAKQAVKRKSDGTFAPGNHSGQRFKPGQSGNPAGRPPGPLTAAIREVLHKDDDKVIKALAVVAVQRAIKGDYRFYKEVLERSDGKVSGRLDVNANCISVEDYPGLSREDLKAIAELHDGPAE